MRINQNSPPASTSPPNVASDHLPITRDIDGTKVMSWNIRWADNDAPSVWTNRLPAIVQTAATSQSDVLCFQEVSPSMLKDLKAQLSQFGYQCDDSTFSEPGIVATFYKPDSVTLDQAVANKYRPGDHTDPTDRWLLMTEFTNKSTGEKLRIANLKGPHLNGNPNPSDADLKDLLRSVQTGVDTALKSFDEPNADVNLCGDWNNKITPSAIQGTGFVNHSDTSNTALGTQVGTAFTDAENGIFNPNHSINRPGHFTKVDDQFLEMNGTNKDVDTKVDTDLFSWGPHPTPPPVTPEVQKYEDGLKAWLTQNEGKQNGYLGNTFVQPLLDKLNATPAPFSTVLQITTWLNQSADGQALVKGLLSSGIYSADPDLANMDPMEAQKEVQSLLTTLGVTTLAPAYSVPINPPGPPPVSPEVQKYEDNLMAWLKQNEPQPNGYLFNHFVQPVMNKLNEVPPPFSTVIQITTWLKSTDGKAVVSGLLSSSIYSADPDFVNMDPIQAQKVIQSLLTTLGITTSVPLYPVTPIPPGPTPGYIDKLEAAMKTWAGTNPPYGTSGRQAFDNYLVSYIKKNNITSAAGLNSAMADFLKTNDPRGIYFKCPGLNSADLASAFSVMGLNPAPTVPPMSNLAKSFSNVVNYCNTHTKDVTHYMKPFYALRDYLAQSVNITENQFKSFLNGSFRKDPNINFKNFSAVPAYQHQLNWFSTANLPDWKP